VFFRVSRARNRTRRCAAAHKKQSSGLFFSPRVLYFSRTVCYGITVQVSANYFYIV